MRALLLLPLAGCGLGIVDNTSGGADNLPTAGAGPYGRLDPDLDTPADEPFVLADRREHYADAACLWRDDGGLRLWFTYTTDADPVERIGYAEVPGLHDLPDVAPRALFPGAAPSVVVAGDQLVMAFEQDGRIVHALSDDDGATWQQEGILTTGTDPALAVVDGALEVFFARDGMIWHEGTPVVGGGEPHVLVETSAAGRHHWGLWFTVGAGEQGTAVDYLGSFDGQTWERFAGGPVLTAPAGGPCVLLDGPSGVLLYHEEQRLHLGIAAAVHP